MGHKESKTDFYPEDGRGFCLIINYKKNREGSEHDVERLIKFFRDELLFIVYHAPENMKEKEFIDLLESFENIFNIRTNLYCFVCVIMGHGDEMGIQTEDDKRIPVERIVNIFDNTRMRSFAGKPKWFIINSCRGDKYTNTTSSKLKTDTAIGASEHKKQVALEGSDVAVFKSTIQGHVSWRDDKSGSFFIQTCIDVFKESYRTRDIDDMMRTVNNRLQKTVDQVAEKTTTMTRKLRLVSQKSLYMALLLMRAQFVITGHYGVIENENCLLRKLKHVL